MVRNIRLFMDVIAMVLLFFSLAPLFLYYNASPLFALVAVLPAGLFVSARRLDVSPRFRRLVTNTYTKDPRMAHLRWSPFNGGKFTGSFEKVPFTMYVHRFEGVGLLGGLRTYFFLEPKDGESKQTITVKHDDFEVTPSRFGYYSITCHRTAFEKLPKVLSKFKE